MQRNYIYFLTEPMGKNLHANFRPQLTPKQMLALGVFGGKYLTDGTDEFPSDWFERAKLNHERLFPELNFFGVNASRPADQAVERHERAYCADQGKLRKSGPELPAETEAGATALGV